MPRGIHPVHACDRETSGTFPVELRETTGERAWSDVRKLSSSCRNRSATRLHVVGDHSRSPPALKHGYFLCDAAIWLAVMRLRVTVSRVALRSARQTSSLNLQGPGGARVNQMMTQFCGDAMKSYQALRRPELI
jgi:hypothetical protein